MLVYIIHIPFTVDLIGYLEEIMALGVFWALRGYFGPEGQYCPPRVILALKDDFGPKGVILAPKGDCGPQRVISA
jgi:hypothetical protein